MKRVIGYGDRDIIEFKNMRNETIEAVEVRTSDTIYLVKVSSKLNQYIIDFDLYGDLDDDDLRSSNDSIRPNFDEVV